MRRMGRSPNREFDGDVCRKRLRTTLRPKGDHPASSESKTPDDTERTHLKYSGNVSDIIACLISPMMSRYRWRLCLVASTAYRISPDWNKWRRYAREYLLQV